jgi:hypothetical protein
MPCGLWHVPEPSGLVIRANSWVGLLSPERARGAGQLELVVLEHVTAVKGGPLLRSRSVFGFAVSEKTPGELGCVGR